MRESNDCKLQVFLELAINRFVQSDLDLERILLYSTESTIAIIETMKILCGQFNARCTTCPLSIKSSIKNLHCFYTATATESDVTSLQLLDIDSQSGLTIA